MIYTEELARVDAPRILDNVGLGIVGPSLIGRRHARAAAPPLPGISRPRRCGRSVLRAQRRSATSRRCAPSATRDGDEWVIDGQKVWSSRAHLARWCLLLARTDAHAPKHKGSQCLLRADRRAG
jgi:alkylation response protein AidB-like acyl-CoA dehydrogenase